MTIHLPPGRIPFLLGFVLAALLSGCATAPARPEPVDPHSRRTMLGLMQQLSETQSAYRKMAKARDSGMVALQALEGVEVEVVPYSPSDIKRWCPSVARTLSAPEQAAVTDHQRRLAQAFVALDRELRAAGHGSAGCRVVDAGGDETP